MLRPLRAAYSPLTDLYDVALLDLDGVVYIGPQAVSGAAEVLATARQRGMRLAFVTNNAARPPAEVADHLTGLGITARITEIVTSAQSAARYLADQLPGGAHVLVVGTTGLTQAVRDRGLIPVDTAQGHVDAVVQGYSPGLTAALLAEGAVAINRGARWVATNLDPTIPSARGPLPGNGSFVAAMRCATGHEPTVTGKPDPTMHRESVLRSGAESPIVVGDRLDTDIEGANAVGCASLLVFTGVTTPRDLLAAPPKLRPTYLAPGLSGLLVAHRAPERDEAGWACGSWRGRRDGARLQLQHVGAARTGAGDPEQQNAVDVTADNSPDDDAIDALRALCAAWWSSQASLDASQTPDGIDVRAGDQRAVRALASLGLT